MQDLKANESRLRDINKVAAELESEGLMAEETPMVQAQVPGCSSTGQTHISAAEASTCVLLLVLQQQELLGAAPGKVPLFFFCYVQHV